MKKRGITLWLGLFLVAFLVVTSSASAVNEVRIECPVVSQTAVAGDSIAISVHITNDVAIGGFSLGFHYNSDMVEITQVTAGPMISALTEFGGVFRRTFEPISNQVLVGWYDSGTEAPLVPQVDGLAFTLYMKLLPGVITHSIDIDSVYVPPSGPFIFSEIAGGTIKPGYVDCGTEDVVISLPVPPYFFIHLSDPHVGNPGADQRLGQFATYFKSVLHPSFIVLTGDLVQRGECSTYWEKFEMVKELFNPIPVYAIAGNHDEWGFDATKPELSSYASYFVDSLRTVATHLNLLTVYSGEDLDCNPDGSRGTGLSGDQIDWLTGKLGVSAEYLKVIGMHHPVFNLSASDGCISQNRVEFMDTCQSRKVSLVLSGHTHTNFQYAVDTSFLPHILPASTAPWSTENLGQPLPIYAVTASCGKDLAYRRISVDHGNITVHRAERLPSPYSVQEYIIGKRDVSCPSSIGLPGDCRGERSASGSIIAPGRLHAFDESNFHVGVNDIGGIDLEIDGAYYEDFRVPLDSAWNSVLIGQEKISLYLDPGHTYTYRFESASSCTLDVKAHLLEPTGGGETFVFYPELSLDSSATMTALVIGGHSDFVLRVDDDGDGVVDRSVPPDSIVTSRDFVCGDANGDAVVDISDAVYLIAYIFSGGSAPTPLLAGDANCDSAVDISDVVYLIAYIFSGGQAPCAACK